GRIWTSRAWQTIPVDLGASWIHGVRGNPLTSLADGLQVPRLPTDYDSAVLYDLTGKEMPDRAWRDVSSFISQGHKAVRRARASQKDVSVETALRMRLNLELLSEDELRLFEFAVSEEVEKSFAADISELSAQRFNEGKEFKGGDVLFPGGYDALLNHLSSDLKIKFGRVVDKLKIDGDLVTVTANDEEWSADRVILTLPIGVLKKEKIQFDPALPEKKNNAIAAIGSGLLNKVTLKFPDTFWDRKPHWITRLSQEKGAFSTWLNFVPYTGAPVLQAFNAGSFARRMEQLSDEEITERAFSSLKTLYGNTIPEPTSVQTTRWESDPFASCSYSFPALGMTEHSRIDLAEPILNRLFFAGEATSSDYPSTVHGAYLSGLREADRISQILEE
ncbi:MAG: FAD-dependent oxidoreductase, partial [Verrucomicrobiota bacterium]